MLSSSARTRAWSASSKSRCSVSISQRKACALARSELIFRARSSNVSGTHVGKRQYRDRSRPRRIADVGFQPDGAPGHPAKHHRHGSDGRDAQDVDNARSDRWRRIRCARASPMAILERPCNQQCRRKSSGQQQHQRAEDPRWRGEVFQKNIGNLDQQPGDYKITGADPEGIAALESS